MKTSKTAPSAPKLLKAPAKLIVRDEAAVALKAPALEKHMREFQIIQRGKQTRST